MSGLAALAMALAHIVIGVDGSIGVAADGIGHFLFPHV